MRNAIVLGCLLLLLSCQKDSAENNVAPVIAPAPEAAILSLPKDKELCLGGTKLNGTYSEVSFEWQASKNTNNYDVTITNLNTNQSQTKFTTLNRIDVALEAGIPYSWYVTSKSNVSNTTTNSVTWKFYLSGNGGANLAPYPADALVPKSGTTVNLVDGKATFSWVGQDPDSNTLTYEIFLDTDQSKVVKEEVAPIKSSSNTTSIALKASQVYYWKVKTSDGNLSSFTQVFSFRTL